MKMMKENPHEYDDNFGKSGFASQTIKITLMTIIFWLIVIFPFVFVLLSLYLSPHPAEVWGIIIGIGVFFAFWFVGLGMLSLILTLLNNWQIHRQAHHKITYNRKGVEQKKLILQRYFTKKYGKHLHQQDDYTIASDNNIPLNEFMKLYQKAGVDKRDGS